MAYVGEIRLPLRARGSVDCGNGELTWLEIVGGAYREALGDVSCYGGSVGDHTVLERERAVGDQSICCGIVVADLNGDGGVGEGHVGSCEGLGEARDGGMGSVSDGGNGPALPVECAVFESGYLRWKGWVEAESEVGSETEA